MMILIARIITAREAATEATTSAEMDRLLEEFKQIVTIESEKASKVFTQVMVESCIEALSEIIGESTIKK